MRETRPVPFYGGSFITDETGAVVRQMGRTEEGFACATFDLDAIGESRRKWGIFRDRRPEMYGIIASHGRTPEGFGKSNWR
jgi:N-carbamoylputrescine amidase